MRSPKSSERCGIGSGTRVNQVLGSPKPTNAEIPGVKVKDPFNLWLEFLVQRKKEKKLLETILSRENDIVGRLDAITAALDAAQSTAADESVQVQGHFARLSQQIADLQSSLDELVAAQVTQEEIDAVVAQVQAIADSVEAIDTEGDAPPPVEPVP